MIQLLFVIAVTVATVWLGILATKKAKTASDFFVAGRSVNSFWNASAISGEYLSAASFMGVAGLIMKVGYDALWYPVGYAAGYLFLLLFIAGPLRRFGAYTIPDFAQGRFDSLAFRKVAVIFVLFIGFFYTMPQMKGAGVTMMTIMGWPYWVGILVVGGVITFNVAAGGMKGITLVQAFQYWVKVFAIAAPLFVLMAVYGPYGSAVGANAESPKDVPRMNSSEAMTVKGSDSFPSNVMSFATEEPTILLFPEGAKIAKIVLSRPSDQVTAQRFIARSQRGVRTSMQDLREPDGKPIEPKPKIFDVEDVDVSKPFSVPANHVLAVFPQSVVRIGDTGLTGGVITVKIEFAEKAKVRLFSGHEYVDEETGDTRQAEALAPNAPTNETWLNPFGTLTSKHGHPLLYTYSLIIALVCGTAGLPHILVRFYTNPDGRSAKKTALWVMILLGVFYVFTPIWGALGRLVIPQLYANHTTDSVVIKLPTLLENPLLGQILSGITSAGAFAAFMSTFSGLLVSMSGAFAHDIYGRILRPASSPESRLRAFQIAAVAVGSVAMLLGLLVEEFDIAMMVGWAFAIGAASYFPLLLLGSWWRGLTKYGAAIGMLVGGLLSLAAIVTSMLLDKKLLTFQVSPLVRSLLEQPAIWGVPLAIGTMVVVSLVTRRSLPKDVNEKMLRLHAPEELGLSKNYVD